jgi:catalase
VQRTFATVRSVELDALLLAGAPAPGSDAYGARDAKAGGGTDDGGNLDPRVVLLVAEAFRHAKPIGGWARGEQALQAAGCDPQAPGVAVGPDANAVLGTVSELLEHHRVWDRFPAQA